MSGIVKWVIELSESNTGSRPERKLEGLLILLAKKVGSLLVTTDRRRRCSATTLDDS